MIDYVALDPSKAADSGAGNTIVAANLIAAPSGIDECDPPVGIMSQHVVLDIGGVKSLLGYAIAVEYDPVTIFERKIVL
jgi:hypothetical protein